MLDAELGHLDVMDIERARFNMIESQIRPWEVLDQQVLDTLFEVKREEFVPEKYRALAFVDMEIPLGHGEVMLAPKLEARMLQEQSLEMEQARFEVGASTSFFERKMTFSASAFVQSTSNFLFTRYAGH